MNKEDKILLVWIELWGFLDEIQKYISALDALESIKGSKDIRNFTDNCFIQTCVQAMERQYIIEIEQIFDKPHFKERDNCSFRLLYELCLEDSQTKNFPRGEKDELLIALIDCCNYYKKVIPIEIRNRLMAHHDLERILSLQESFIIFEDVKKLINQSVIALEKIGSIIAPFDPVLPPMEANVDIYKDAIIAIASNS